MSTPPLGVGAVRDMYASRLSDLRLIYYGKAGFGHISRIFSLNSQLFASKTREICLKPVFPSLRSLKSDRLLVADHASELMLATDSVCGKLSALPIWIRPKPNAV